MKYEWRTNRFFVSLAFIVTGVWALFRPKVALKIVEYYGRGRDAERQELADKDLSN